MIGATSLERGNTNADGVATELDAGKFKVIESYSEMAVYPWGMPVRFHLDLAGNPADVSSIVQDENFAYGFGVKLGNLAKKGGWQASYQCR